MRMLSLLSTTLIKTITITTQQTYVIATHFPQFGGTEPPYRNRNDEYGVYNFAQTDCGTITAERAEEVIAKIEDEIYLEGWLRGVDAPLPEGCYYAIDLDPREKAQVSLAQFFRDNDIEADASELPAARPVLWGMYHERFKKCQSC